MYHSYKAQDDHKNDQLMDDDDDDDDGDREGGYDHEDEDQDAVGEDAV